MKFTPTVLPRTKDEEAGKSIGKDGVEKGACAILLLTDKINNKKNTCTLPLYAHVCV